LIESFWWITVNLSHCFVCTFICFKLGYLRILADLWGGQILQECT
jgi:hypothetical protein